jgi:hypothetical protein
LYVKSKKSFDVREGSLLTLELKRAYYVPVRDSRVSDLITWYFVTLQKAIDIIWGNIRWELRKPKLVRRNGTLQVIMGFKYRIHTENGIHTLGSKTTTKHENRI